MLMKYFFVSQSKTYKEEHLGNFLWAPNKPSWHHQNMVNVKQGDAIIQYKKGEIVGIAIASRDSYSSAKPSDSSFDTWASNGFKVDVEQYHFKTPVKLDSIKDELSTNQPPKHAPLNTNGSVNQIYLADANEEMVNIVLNKALEINQTPEQVEIVKKIRDALNLPVNQGSTMDNKRHLEEKEGMMQKIFFGAPGTGKSYKINSILPNESVWNLTGEERKSLFEGSDVAKKGHYTLVLSNEAEFGGNVWNINELSLLEKKLSEVDSNDNVNDPKHSALRAYINFLKEYKFEQTVFRTTFHPDYDYAQFVGAYKPKKDGEKITYSFVPQVFAKAYAAAWRLQLSDDANKNVFLVIEEINRGNCAQIFGDIFQLLDRDGDGFSQYSIDADCDFAEWLETDEKGLKFVWDKYKETVGEGKLKLPPNLNILATMNTSDQSLFPMDSAFKRRFDWEYVPISFDGKDAANFQIDVDGTQYSWQKFVETVNEKILTLTESEDKQLGEFFIKPDSGNVISKDRFLGKVMFYLWNEVCKDEHKNGSFFRTKDGDKEKYFTFQDLYRDKGLLKRFIEKLFEEGPSQE